ncbi:MAG: multidrug DMT transporter permease [Cyclobacteriaceae bacterium]|nr:multidrug DMT transporter permease [Cyclobacteriaceae bacterium]
MIVVSNYPLAVLFTVMAMICWGSWANTQKLVQGTWRFELFYWDMVIGILILSIVAAFTVGSMGSMGRTFLDDLAQADAGSIISAMLGGVVWNLGNLLLVAAIAVAGMSVGFPIGGGIAWVLGIIVNYILIVMDKGRSEDNTVLLFAGVGVIIVAIILSMKAYRRLASEQKKPSLKGILLSIFAGLLIAFFYGLVVNSLSNEYVAGGTGSLTPFTAVFFFAVGVFISTFIFNPIFMARPVQGEPVKMAEYWRGRLRDHLIGILGGSIWMLGMILSFMAAGSAGPAISYALSNAAPVVAILWGVLVWKEFAGAPKGTNRLLVIMFIAYLIGLMFITYSKV